MSAISSCPRCQRQVTIPAEVDAAASVRCPLCDAEYPLSEALALAPPELIPVVPLTPSEPRPVTASELAAAKALLADLSFFGPHDELAAEAEEEGELGRHDEESFEYALAGETAAGGESAVAVAEGVAKEGEAAEQTPVQPARRRRKRPPKSFLQATIEIITGGVAGCLFAYYGLAWYLGPRFDLPKFGMPFIEQLTADPSNPNPEGGVRKKKVEPPLKPAVEKPAPVQPAAKEEPKPDVAPATPAQPEPAANVPEVKPEATPEPAAKPEPSEGA